MLGDRSYCTLVFITQHYSHPYNNNLNMPIDTTEIDDLNLG
jgi:hypothetical protein